MRVYAFALACGSVALPFAALVTAASSSGCDITLNKPFDDAAADADAESFDAAGACLPAGTLCGAICVDVANDNKNCGECNHPCAAGEACGGGRCAITIVDASSDGPIDPIGDASAGDVADTADVHDVDACSPGALATPPTCLASDAGLAMQDTTLDFASATQLTAWQGPAGDAGSGGTAIRAECTDGAELACVGAGGTVTRLVGPGRYHVLAWGPSAGTPQWIAEPPPSPALNVDCANAAPLANGAVVRERIVDGKPRTFAIATAATTLTFSIAVRSGYGTTTATARDTCLTGTTLTSATAVAAGQKDQKTLGITGNTFIDVTAPAGVEYELSVLY